MVLSTYKGFIFDLDGVLWDSISVHSNAFKKILELYGVKNFDYYEFAGMSTKQAFMSCARLVPLKNQEIFMQDVVSGKVVKLKQEIAHRQLKEFNVLSIKKNLAFMNLISHKSKAIVTGSSKKNLEVFLKKSEFMFDVIINGEEVESKPNPAGYSLAINKLNLSPNQCVVFEDSEKGLQAALEAGASAVHIFGFWENKCTSHPSSKKAVKFQCYESINDWFAKVYG